jgi:hypothetical protein
MSSPRTSARLTGALDCAKAASGADKTAAAMTALTHDFMIGSPCCSMKPGALEVWRHAKRTTEV